MKKYLYFLSIFVVLFGCKNEEELKALSNSRQMSKDSLEVSKDTTTVQINEFAIVIHGGAGNILKENMPDAYEASVKSKLEEAIRVGYEILKNGGSSLDAVEKTINVLEDSPLFNAGKGAVFTNAETNELDASIMDGSTLNAGASAGAEDC